MNNMKKKLVLFASVSIALASCQTTPKEDYSWIKKGLDVASAQLQLSAEEVSGTGMFPRSIRTGYDMDFLCRQLERDSLTFKDSLRAQPAADQLGTVASATFMTGRVVSSPVHCGTHTN